MKYKIFCILSVENIMLYFGFLVIGVVVGFLILKFVLMILFKIVDVKVDVKLYFFE